MRQLVIVFSLFTFLSLLLFWPVFLGKVNLNANLLVSFYPLYGENLPFKNTGWDALRIYFPFYKVTLDAFRSLSFPLWNPYTFAGHPHMADFQSAVFYPLNIFGLILLQIEFWHLLRITPTILAAFFTFVYLRGLKLSKIASLFGAVVFGFSPFILTWGEEVVMSVHSIVWLPLILFGIDRFGQTGRRKFLGLISVGIAASFLGGYMQTTIYVGIFVCAYFLLRFGFLGIFSKRGFLVTVALIVGVMITAIQLLPSAELYFMSARAQIALTEKLYEFLLPVESLLTYLAPDFFGNPATGNFFRMGSAQYYEGILFAGIAVLVFATLSILYKRRDKLVWFLTVVMAVSLLTVLDSGISRWFLTLPIPFLSTSIPNRVLFIGAFCLAVLGALGMDLWLRGQVRARGVLSFYALAYFLIIATLLILRHFNLPYFEHAKFVSGENTAVSLRNLIVPVAVFILSAVLILAGGFLKKRRLAAILICLAAIAQTFYFSQKYFSFSERKYVFPSNAALDFVIKNQNYDRSWEIGQNFFPNNFASYYGIFWPGGYDSLNNRSYSEFSYAMQGNNLSDYSFRADAGLGQGNAKELFDLPGGVERKRLMDLLGVKFLIGKSSEAEVMEKHGFLKVFEQQVGGEWVSVFENSDAMPRAFLASNYEGPPNIFRPGESDEEKRQKEKERRKLIFSKLLSGDFDFKNVLILEKPSPISPQYGQGEAEILSYRPLEVTVETKSREPKLLFLSDNYYPGWKASVDGDETEIFRANYTFRAVPLTGGEHMVRFYYDPMSFKLGLVITVISLGATLYLSVFKRRIG